MTGRSRLIGAEPSPDGGSPSEWAAALSPLPLTWQSHLTQFLLLNSDPMRLVAVGLVGLLPHNLEEKTLIS